MTSKQRLIKAQKQADEFNKVFPVGTPCKLIKDNGEIIETRTRAKAQIVCESAVTWLRGVTGCYILDRVIPLHGESK